MVYHSFTLQTLILLPARISNVHCGFISHENSLQLVYYLLGKWDKRLYSFVSAVKICELHEVFTELSGHFKVKNGKISAQFHTTLCIQFLDRENNDKDNTLPLGKQICFTEILPEKHTY